MGAQWIPPRYLKEPRPVVLNVRRRLRRQRVAGMIVLLAAGLLALLFNMGDRRPAVTGGGESSAAVSDRPQEWSGHVAKLAETRVETALAKLEQDRPDEALALMVSALAAEPRAADARQLAERILRETTWHFPVLALPHPLPVERLAHHAPSTLWVGLTGETSTLVRWNLESLAIESVLFPLQGESIRSLQVDPGGRRLVVERAGVLLLCDALTLKPLRDLGELPDFATPSSVVVFSADGLLMAHPAMTGSGEDSLVWRIRETQSGEILREAETSGMAKPLSAHLDRHALHVLLAEGTRWTVPVTPVEPETAIPAADAITLLHAAHSSDGRTVLALMDCGPHKAPTLLTLPAGEESDGTLGPLAMLERFPWSLHPGVWNGLLREADDVPIRVEAGGITFLEAAAAPMFAPSDIHAVAASGGLKMTGCGDGTVQVHLTLPLPATHSEAPDKTPDAAAVAAFRQLTAALAAVSHDEAERRFQRVGPSERLHALETCDFTALRRLFPMLDFQPVIDAVASHRRSHPSPAALEPLVARLARAQPDGSGPPSAATSLKQALESESADLIHRHLESAENLPPLLRKLVESRIAWLEDRTADAMAAWPDEFPNMARLRLREDWDGWEQADFTAILEGFGADMETRIALLELPAGHDAATRRELFDRLTDSETLRAVGRRRFARACLQAALAFSKIPDEAGTTLILAEMARTHGGNPAACLRAEARALMQLDDHPKAHDRWILLISEFPIEDHESSDYADAAYTAFENADPRQAMEILAAGMRRFPDEADFALRAGWISLLTGNPQQAYAFLGAGRQSGYPDDKIESALVLLMIAAAQCGESDEAIALHEEVIELNPAWADPQHIEELSWPDEFKASLRQLTW
jgi:tetratricopeptide (TPR) repeat protein